MKNQANKKLLVLLTPSWLSGLIAALAALAVTGGTVVVVNYQTSSLREEIFTAQASGASITGFDYQSITDNLARNRVLDNLPLFLFWTALGLIVYLFAVNLWQTLTNAERLRDELKYVNASRQNLIRTTFTNLLVRLMALLVWIVYLEVFLKVLLPYTLAASYVAATDLVSLSGIMYVVLAFAVMFLAVQVHAVFLRLALLRVRVFGGLLL